MKPSEELFELIHALNQTEKRYFKIFAGKNSDADNVYIRLFEAIDRQNSYDEKALREKFRDEPFVKQLHVAKNYLYKVLLRSLAAYHSKTSVNAQVLELLRTVEILFEKGFYKQCLKLINKGKALCAEYEKHILLAQLCEWEAKLHSRRSKFELIRECITRESQALERVQTMLRFKQKAFGLYDQVVKMGVARNRAQRKLLDRTLRDPLLKGGDAALSNEARYYMYSIFSLHASSTGNRKKHYEYTRKILDIFERNKPLREEYPYHYIGSLNNLCNALFYLGRNKEAIAIVKKMRDFCAEANVNKWEDAYTTGLLISYDLEITAHLNTGQFQKIPELIQPVESMLALHGKKLKESYLLDLIYDMAYGLFIVKDYDRSLAWLLRIIHENQLTTRYDIYGASRILHLVLHYELGNETLLRNIIKPTSKFLEKRKRLHLPEKIFLRFLDAHLKLKDAAKRAEAFKKLQKEIQAALKNPMEQRVLQYFDIPAWIESKLQKKDLSIILKQKTQKNKS